MVPEKEIEMKNVKDRLDVDEMENVVDDDILPAVAAADVDED